MPVVRIRILIGTTVLRIASVGILLRFSSMLWKTLMSFCILDVIGTLKQYINQIIFLKIHFRMTLQGIQPVRVGTSIVQPVNSSGKCRKLSARQILQKSLRWHLLAFMSKIKLKTCEIKTYYLILQKMTLESITY